MNTLLLAVLPLAGVALGAFLQTRRELKNQKKTLKIKSYTDYLQACAQMASKDVGKHSDAKTALADAKARITIYGSAEVIKEIADFDRHGARVDSPEDMKRFLRITLSMRDAESKDKAKNEDIARLLFGVDIR